MSEFLKASDWCTDLSPNASTFFESKEAIDREENGPGENRASLRSVENKPFHEDH